MKVAVIGWTAYNRRSELLAHHLNASLHFVHFGQKGNTLQLPLKYLVQFIQTWRILRRELPDLVIAQNPPIFCPLAVYLFSLFHGARFAIDSHTGALAPGKWYWSIGLHRFLSGKAVLTLVHNTSQEKTVRAWGCKHSVLGYTPGDYPQGEPYPMEGKWKIAVTCTYAEDEPLEQIFAAAEFLPEVNFYLTGNPHKLPPRLLERKPPNCTLTGYLSYEGYVGLLRGADAVMDLTTRNHTLLMGGFESVSLGKPLITSDWPILKEYFSSGAVYVDNSAEGIAAGVRSMLDGLPSFRRDILLLRKTLQSEWESRIQEIQFLIGDRPETSPSALIKRIAE
jgi:hypothetical protein